MQINNILKGLTESQREFFNEAIGHSNVFLTGVAGTGKSYAVEKYIKYCKSQGIGIGITASTGIAALNIGGVTLHSFLGIGLGLESADVLIKKINNNKYNRKKLKSCKVLLIDEISMISGTLLNKIDEVLKGVRFSTKPFGGVKLIVVGDHMQLPPVSEEEDYCFESTSWKKAGFVNVMLQEIVRQKDKEFAELLSEIRVGNLKNIDLLKGRIKAEIKGVKTPVKLYSHNRDVEKENLAKLREIKEPSVFYDAEDDGNEYALASLDKSCPASKRTELRVGAQVMLLRNLSLESGLCNGSVGTVVSLNKRSALVRFRSGEFLIELATWEIIEPRFNASGGAYYQTTASRTQIPLKLAYAVTIHKSQGQTLDAAEIDLSKCFESGQAYVALSRVRDLSSLSLLPFDSGRILVNHRALNFYKNLK